MSQKRKISGRKIMQLLVTLVVTTGCIMAICGASKMEQNKKINGIEVQIRNEDKCRFISKPQVLNMLIDSRHIDIYHTPLTKLDIHTMEQIVSTNPWIRDAQIYIDNQKVLHISVDQRVPVARVFDESGSSYYIDTTLKTMPLSLEYVYYTTVVTNAPILRDDSIGNSIKAQIVYLVSHIERDTFWNAQVSQISMMPDYTFELVPVLGYQRIILGDTSRLQDKLDNLFVFYKNVLNRIGWDKYQVLDLRFKDQVIASPNLPWKAPVDNAMVKMDWVKSIMDGGKDKDDNIDTLPALKRAPVATKKTIAKPVAVPAPVKKEIPKAAIKPVAKKEPKAIAAKPKRVPAKTLKKETPKVAAHPVAKKEIKPAARTAKIKPKLVAVPKPTKKEKTTDKKSPVKSKKETPKPKYIYPENNNQ